MATDLTAKTSAKQNGKDTLSQRESMSATINVKETLHQRHSDYRETKTKVPRLAFCAERMCDGECDGNENH
jgi:hypothetical protein